MLNMVVLPQTPVRPQRPVGTARSFRLAFLSSFLLVALGGALLSLGWNLTRPATAHSSPAAVPASLPAPSALSSPSQAEHLYSTIRIAMSLYDLDQTAGGTGRVIQVEDPHILLLSYDYPDRTVRVSLNRADVTNDDYRVQTVALYRGKTLLQRHTELE